jgi:hypothetical protein
MYKTVILCHSLAPIELYVNQLVHFHISLFFPWVHISENYKPSGGFHFT